MAHDPALKEKAEEMFVVNGFSMDTICAMLPEVARKTLYNWRNEDNWESKRRERVEKTKTRRERIEAQIDKILDELDIVTEPKLIFALGKLVAALKSASTFQFTEEKKEKSDSEKKGLTPERVREIEEKLKLL